MSEVELNSPRVRKLPMGFNPMNEKGLIFYCDTRGKLCRAAAPAGEPFLVEQWRCQGMPGSTFGSIESDRGLGLRPGADTLGDKEARVQQGDAHGGGCGVSVKFCGFGRAAANYSCKNFASPQRGFGLI